MGGLFPAGPSICTCGHHEKFHLCGGMGCSHPDGIGDFCGCRRYEFDVCGKAARKREEKARKSVRDLRRLAGQFDRFQKAMKSAARKAGL